MMLEIANQQTIDLSQLPKLPSGWKWVVPEEVCVSVASGSTPTADKMFSSNGEVPFLKVYNLTFDGSLDFTIKPTFIDRTTHDGMLKRSQAFSGDVLMNIVGPPLGKVSLIPPQIAEANINQAIVVFRVSPQILAKYLVFALLTKSVLQRITSKAKATAGQFNIGVVMCRSLLPIPLAPLPTQRRIVAEIEKQFTRLDAGVAALRRVQANLKRYRAAVLKAACEGRLVPTEAELQKSEARGQKSKAKSKAPRGVQEVVSSGLTSPTIFETGEQLLARILADRRKKWPGRGSYKEPIPPDTANLPSNLPEGWICASIDQITENFDGRRVPLKSADRDKRSGQYPYYGASGIIDDIDGFLFDGDFLLIAEDGANLLSRSTPIAFRATGKFWVNNHAHIVQTLGGIPLSFLSVFLNGKNISFSVTGSAQPKLTQAALNKIPVPLPPLAEQKRIVAEVERRLSVIDELETLATANLTRATRLRQSILQRAFSGELAS